MLNIRLDKEISDALSIKSSESNKSKTEIVEDALREYLHVRKPSAGLSAKLLQKFGGNPK